MPFSRLRKGAFCIFLNPRLNGKPGVVHLYWQLMACGSRHPSGPTEEVTEEPVIFAYLVFIAWVSFFYFLLIIFRYADITDREEEA